MGFVIQGYFLLLSHVIVVSGTLGISVMSDAFGLAFVSRRGFSEGNDF